MLAVSVVHDGARPVLAVREQQEPDIAQGEVLVAVRAVSLNNGEVREALAAPEGHRFGWDFAGTVLRAPEDAGVAAGERIFGLASGTCAQQVAAPAPFLARIPDAVSFEMAAALPVAGMTAAGCLAKRPLDAGERLLVTAASGGVGVLAIQLGKASGAHVTALVRDRSAAALLHRLGADEVVDADEAAKGAPYDLILDGVGGALLGRALEWLGPRGMCVNFGDAAGDELTTFDARRFRLGGGGIYGGTSLYGFFLLEELTRPQPLRAPEVLADLARRVAAGTLDPVVSRTAGWREADAVARALLKREFPGKAVLLVE